VDEGEVCLTVAWVAYIPCENPHTLPRHFNSLPALSLSGSGCARHKTLLLFVGLFIRAALFAAK
jgi:hypothetical protein